MPLAPQRVDILRPVASLGAYRLATQTGTIAAGAAALSPWLSFRWTNATNLAVVRSVRIALQADASFTNGNAVIDMIVARSFNASDTGGTALTPLTTQKMRTSMGASLLGDLRVSATAALVAGTRTLDANPVAGAHFGVSTTGSTIQLPNTQIFDSATAGMWPLVLAQNEGFILRGTLPATGTWTAFAILSWEEVSGLPF